MLIEFSVENFRSFRDKVTLSMVPTKDKSKFNVLKNYFEYASDKQLLQSAVIYGANASGKTNTLKALSFLKHMVTKSHTFQKGEKIISEPFRLNPLCLDKPSKFDVQFIAKGIKYAYGIVSDRNKIHEEYLYYWPNERQRILFERSNTNEYKFTSGKTEQGTISKLTADNILYLSNAYKLNLDLVADAYEWFENTLQYTDNMHEAASFKLLYNDETIMTAAISALEIADFGIKSLKISERELDQDFAKWFPQEFRDQLKEQGLYEVKAVHNVIFDEENAYSAELLWKDESRGTRKFLSLIVRIILTLRDGDVFCIDEMDVSLHPKLTQELLGLFHDHEINKHNAQIIFTTHDTNLLNQDIFRRDQIWLTERDPTTGVSDLYSLAELKIRNDENIEKGYLSGRYGAIPFIKEGEFHV